jgi:hypothetical protein
VPAVPRGRGDRAPLGVTGAAADGRVSRLRVDLHGPRVPVLRHRVFARVRGRRTVPRGHVRRRPVRARGLDLCGRRGGRLRHQARVPRGRRRRPGARGARQCDLRRRRRRDRGHVHRRRLPPCPPPAVLRMPVPSVRRWCVPRVLGSSLVHAHRIPGNRCTRDFCNHETGCCVHEPIDCNPGNDRCVARVCLAAHYYTPGRHATGGDDDDKCVVVWSKNCDDSGESLRF